MTESVLTPSEPNPGGVVTSPPAPAEPGSARELSFATRVRMEAAHLNFWYGRNQALHDISIRIPERSVTAFIGPSGCGKSTFLRCLNRMNDLIPETRVEGSVRARRREHLRARTSTSVDLRRRVGMVFQKSNPFPKSIFDNVAYGLRINGSPNAPELAERRRGGAPAAPPSGTR